MGVDQRRRRQRRRLEGLTLDGIAVGGMSDWPRSLIKRIHPIPRIETTPIAIGIRRARSNGGRGCIPSDKVLPRLYPHSFHFRKRRPGLWVARPERGSLGQVSWIREEGRVAFSVCTRLVGRHARLSILMVGSPDLLFQSTNPCRRAMTAAWVRSVTPSLVKIPLT